MHELKEQQVGTIKDAASKLTGPKRRAFQAQVTLDDLEGRARRAERVFGWGRNTVELGLHELVTSLPTACSNGGMPTAECHAHIRQLVINLDNGPQNSSFRTQFMKPMVEVADRNGLEIVLVYYPPYHSKYNPIERCWGLLENHWNGTLLDNVTTVLNWAGTMTWKGLRPIVHLLEATYEKGVRVAKKAFQEISQRLQRDKLLPKYFVRISPASCVG